MPEEKINPPAHSSICRGTAMNPLTNPKVDAEAYVGCADIMSYFGLARSSLDRLRANGAFPPPLRLNGKTIRWKKKDVLAYENTLRKEAARRRF